MWVIGIGLAIFIVCCVLTETEHWGWTTLLIIAACLTTQLLHVANLWGFVRDRAALTALYVLAYLGIGIVWSFLKWLSFLLAFRRERRRQRERMAGGPLDWKHISFRGTYLNKTPLASANKGRIVAWITYWPFSLVGTLVSDPLHSLVMYIFEVLSSSYQRVADYVFRDEQGDAP